MDKRAISETGNTTTANVTRTAALKRHACVGDLTGAFADGAILFPLLVALAWQTGASAATMLATTAMAYLAGAWLFRLPIPVQPLKALAITAIAVGASHTEIRLAGAALGGIFLLIAIIDVNRLARLVPVVIVHGVQFGLGVILVLKAVSLIGLQPMLLTVVTVTILAILVMTHATDRPVLGGVAVTTLLWGFWDAASVSTAVETAGVRPWVVAMLVLPQIALSLTNAVLGTERTARAYFGDDAGRVTPRRLLGSLGFGNLAVATVGGMPYCHGSGGVTAHVHGGSRSEWSNVIIASALIALALAVQYGTGELPAYPSFLQAVLLGVVGLLHLRLARTSWESAETRPVLLAMAGGALVSQNILVVVAVGSLMLAARHVFAGTRTSWRQ